LKASFLSVLPPFSFFRLLLMAPPSISSLSYLFLFLGPCFSPPSGFLWFSGDRCFPIADYCVFFSENSFSSFFCFFPERMLSSSGTAKTLFFEFFFIAVLGKEIVLLRQHFSQPFLVGRWNWFAHFSLRLPLLSNSLFFFPRRAGFLEKAPFFQAPFTYLFLGAVSPTFMGVAPGPGQWTRRKRRFFVSQLPRLSLGWERFCSSILPTPP